MSNQRSNTTVETFEGLNNVNDPKRLGDGELTKAVNVDLTNQGTLKRRGGYELQKGGDYHSLWSGGGYVLVASGQQLIKLDDALGETALRSDLTPHERLSYTPHGGEIYYSNGREFGVVGSDGARAWGLPVPSAPSLSSTVGALPAGVYRVCLTYLNANGEESGAGDVATQGVSDGGGLTVTLPSPPSEAASTRVYCTGPNGSEFYLDEETTASSVNITQLMGHGRELTTWGHYRVDPGELVATYKGRLLYEAGRFLVYTEAFAPGRVKADNFVPFAQPLTMIAPVENGVFIGADATYFLGGANISTAELTQVSDSVPIKYTLETLYPGDAPDITLPTAVWASDRGVMMGMPNGQIVPLTEDKFTFPAAEEGTAKLLKRNGIIQLLTVLKDSNDDSNSFGLGDRVSATVYRNGVVIS